MAKRKSKRSPEEPSPKADWAARGDAVAMIRSVQEKASPRKLRLFACACCRRLWPFLIESVSREAVAVGERFADGLAEGWELALAAKPAQDMAQYMKRAKITGWNAALTAAAAAAPDAVEGALRAAAKAADADMVREIFNPFYRGPANAMWPSEIVQLAQAIYAGERCAFALHDALLDAGQEQMAEHFEQPRHYKGCWAVDHLLAKE